ncbi:MAG TPA: ABC transporter permease [Chryseolinea sp.]|nr:ABC transporter permease [Chryseolinea sp.]
MNKQGTLGKNKNISPPKLATWILHWYCKTQLLEDLEGDLNQYFERNLKSKGAFRAKLIYVLDVIKFCRPYTMRRPKPASLFNEVILYQNYYKTSLRTIGRNKLFSSINVFGLAISMCVALLLIAFFMEVRSFDDFHINGDRIFRVNNRLTESNGTPYNYASTSMLTSRKITENITGIEQLTSIHKGFNKDISYNNKTIPLRGFWADENFFKIFSFELISGNAATALKDPKSLVLTESSSMRIFNTTDALGKIVSVDTVDFKVTAVIKDIPLNSHLRFDMLGSYISIDNVTSARSAEWLKWDNMWDHYVYILISHSKNVLDVQNDLDKISSAENKNIQHRTISLYLEPLREIVLPRNMSNSIGPTVDRSTFTLLGTLCFVVILSACFNYTNLSIARALRRVREIGVRKSVGASRKQIFQQFICESTLLSMIALVLSFFFFLFIRNEFISMHIEYQKMLTLEPTLETVAYFIALAVSIGLLAGFLPAAFFSRLNPALVMKDASGLTLFKHVNLRKGLIVFQYTLSILFITLVSIGFRQYRYSLSFNLGFKTDNILSIDLQRNNAQQIIKELNEIPEVRQIARAGFVSSVGDRRSAQLKYKDPSDSISLDYNFIDESYIPLHEHKLIAGTNFRSDLSEETLKSQLIINRHTLTWMKINDPEKAIGEEMTIEGSKYTIIGVMEDFHYERVNYPIQNFGFRYDPSKFEVLNVLLESNDIVTAMNKVEAAWKKADSVHPIVAKFYSEQIENAYEKLSWIVKIVAFLAFLAIIIASLGLLGMVVFITETRIKEISIRKVLGASIANLITLMSKGFIWLLIISTGIAIPAGYFIMDKIIFSRLPYRAPIGIVEIGLGASVVIGLALILIGSQTWNVAKTNPAGVLKSE